MTVHNFQESLRVSQEQSEAGWWECVYRKAFPNFSTMSYVANDGWAQRGGIDRVVILKSGKIVTVDEKVRAEDWPDILLERWSDAERKTPGWVQKNLACDFIAYAFIPTERCYLFPFLQLRRAWLANARKWISLAEQGTHGFKVVTAKNEGWDTESIAVPINDLLKAVQEASVINWNNT